MRSRASAPRASSSYGTWCFPDRTHLADTARARGVRRPGPGERDSCAGFGCDRARGAGGRRRDDSERAAARLCAGARARRLVVGERAARRPRRERARRRRSAAPRRSPPSSPDRCADRRSRSGSPPRCGASTSVGSASACCSNCRSAAPRPRERCWSSGRPSRRREVRRTASTSVAGSRAAASTSSCTGATGGSSVGAAASAASRIACARTSHVRSRPALEGERHAVLAGIVLGEDEGLDGRPARRLQGLRPLPPPGRVRPEHHLPGAGRARAGLAPRDPEACRRGGGDRRDRRATSSRSAGSRRSCARVLQAASRRLPGCSRDPATVGTSSRSAPPSCSRGPRRACSSPASSSPSLRSGRSSCSLPRLRPALEGYPLPDWLREAIAVSTACGAATAPILWLQFGSVPVYSLPANALVTPAIGPLLGIALVGSPDRAGAADRRPRARLAQRLVGRVHRRLCARDRRVAVRSGRLRHRGLPAARDARRAARSAAAAAVAPAAGDHVRGGAAAGAPRVAAPPGGALAAADRAADHIPRCRPGRLDPAPGARGRSARRPGAAGGGCGAPAARPRRPAPRRARAHAPGARPRRRRRGHPEAARGRPRPRSAARRLRPVRACRARRGG